jgi:hypothetical protein
MLLRKLKNSEVHPVPIGDAEYAKGVARARPHRAGGRA